MLSAVEEGASGAGSSLSLAPPSPSVRSARAAVATSCIAYSGTSSALKHVVTRAVDRISGSGLQAQTAAICTGGP